MCYEDYGRDFGRFDSYNIDFKVRHSFWRKFSVIYTYDPLYVYTQLFRWLGTALVLAEFDLKMMYIHFKMLSFYWGRGIFSFLYTIIH